MLFFVLIIGFGLVPGNPQPVAPETFDLTSDHMVNQFQLDNISTIHVNTNNQGPFLLIEGQIKTEAFYPTTTIIEYKV